MPRVLRLLSRSIVSSRSVCPLAKRLSRTIRTGSESPMTQIKFEAQNEGDPVMIVVTGSNFMDTSAKLLTAFAKHFDDGAWAPLFIGLTKLAEGESEFEHQEFSIPEES